MAADQRGCLRHGFNRSSRHSTWRAFYGENAIQRLKRLRYSIGIAESLEKVNGIRGALKGGYLNILVTTDETAAAIIAADG